MWTEVHWLLKGPMTVRCGRGNEELDSIKSR
jgi:hypothetical protein